MRSALILAGLFLTLLPVGSASAADPVICVVTGEVRVLDYTYDPPDPCLL